MKRGALMGRMIMIAAAVLVAGCGERDPSLMNVRSNTSTPDEFGILPTKPLETPQDYAALPPPTPGGTNRVDPTPNADAIAALGGNPAALTRSGVAPADRALMAHAARFEPAPTIRQDLAAADLEFRRRNDGKITERWFNTNVYFRAYRSMSLDKYAELLRWRQLGVRTPSAPPPLAPEN